MHKVFCIILLLMTTVACKTNALNKHIPNEFLVVSYPALRYPQNATLVKPLVGQQKIKETLPLDLGEKSFLNKFKVKADPGIRELLAARNKRLHYIN